MKGSPRRAGATAIGLLTMGVGSALLAAELRELDIQGHRGCRGLRPENSIPAFEKALGLGVTTLELDLQVTRDRVLVVTHDQHLDRSRCRYDDGREVPGAALKDLDLADLAQIDCGGRPTPGFPEQEPVPGARIPTFEEVLQLARDADYPVRLSVEIKMQSDEHGIPVAEFVQLVVDALKKYDLQDRTIIQSFQPPVLRGIRDLAPTIPRAILVRKRGRYDAAIEESAATILSPKHTGLRERDVRRMQERGIPVIPWTVNDPADIRRLLGWGVDGIITDYPDRVIAIRDGD